MKKILIMLATVFCLAATSGVAAQDLTGRVYECSDNEALLKYITHEFEKDEDFKNAPKEEKEMMQGFLAVTDMKLKITFKKSSKLAVEFKMSLNTKKAKEAGIGWTDRQLLSVVLKSIGSEMSTTETYTLKDNTITTSDGDTMTLTDGGQALEQKEGDLTLRFERVK